MPDRPYLCGSTLAAGLAVVRPPPALYVLLLAARSLLSCVPPSLPPSWPPDSNNRVDHGAESWNDSNVAKRTVAANNSRDTSTPIAAAPLDYPRALTCQIRQDAMTFVRVFASPGTPLEGGVSLCCSQHIIYRCGADLRVSIVEGLGACTEERGLSVRGRGRVQTVLEGLFCEI